MSNEIGINFTNRGLHKVFSGEISDDTGKKESIISFTETVADKKILKNKPQEFVSLPEMSGLDYIGYIIEKERYDFSYGGADQKEQYPAPGVQLTPSQIKSIDVARNPAIPSKFAGAHTAPITNFGRAVVSKMPDKFFEYLINLR